MLSLQTSALSGVTAGRFARLLGNWVSGLKFRKVWSSLVDEAFAFGALCQEDPSQIF